MDPVDDKPKKTRVGRGKSPEPQPDAKKTEDASKVKSKPTATDDDKKDSKD